MARFRKEKLLEVKLNVYDLVEQNRFGYPLGLGAFHTGVELWGVEYAFGHHPYATTGVFEGIPRECANATFREQILLGSLEISSSRLEDVLDRLRQQFKGNTYHPLARNCNHFSNELSQTLLQKPIPGFVNRLASWGSFFSCLLPEGIVPPTPEAQQNLLSGGALGTPSPAYTPFGGSGASLRDDVTATVPSPVASDSGAGEENELKLRRERLARAAMQRMNAAKQSQ